MPRAVITERSKGPDSSPYEALQRLGLPDALITDYRRVRTAKRAPLTMTALLAIQREASKDGLTLEAVVVLCCERNWISYRSGWARRDANADPKASAKTSRVSEMTGGHVSRREK